MNVLPPNVDMVVQGFNTPTLLDITGANRVTVKFEMRRGSTPVGVMIYGHVQETILDWQGYNAFTMQWEPIPYDEVWYPPPNEYSSLFYKQGNAIFDRKCAFYNNLNAYATFGLNFGWMTVTQRNRLITSNWLGEEEIFEFQDHHFIFRKSNGNTWILTE